MTCRFRQTYTGAKMTHITLIGDSIFDNKAYVGRGRSVIEHLHELKPEGWAATLRAVDGSVTGGVSGQVSRIPDETTHVFLSVGGNDALSEIGILNLKVRSSAEVFEALSEVAAAFETRYVDMLRGVLALGLPTTVCTVYNPNYDEPYRQKLAVAALASFNDVIIRQAALHKIPLVDLRLLCDEATDYANPIEPSEQGGEKIARKILEVVSEHDFAQERSVIYF
jgi:lysophospholipase L1-like esterase